MNERCYGQKTRFDVQCENWCVGAYAKSTSQQFVVGFLQIPRNEVSKCLTVIQKAVGDARFQHLELDYERSQLVFL